MPQWEKLIPACSPSKVGYFSPRSAFLFFADEKPLIKCALLREKLYV